MNLLPLKFLAACANPSATGLVCGDSLPQPATTGSNNILTTAFFIAFGIIGSIAVLFLVIGGIRYITSGGNAESVKKAKNQISYSLIGLVIAALAATIVNYVIDKLK